MGIGGLFGGDVTHHGLTDARGASKIVVAAMVILAMNCFHSLFCFTTDGALDFITRFVERCRPWFKLFWLRGDVAFANAEICEYCEDKRITYFIRLEGRS